MNNEILILECRMYALLAMLKSNPSPAECKRISIRLDVIADNMELLKEDNNKKHARIITDDDISCLSGILDDHGFAFYKNPTEKDKDDGIIRAKALLSKLKHLADN